jgi:hypothetical protein
MSNVSFRLVAEGARATTPNSDLVSTGEIDGSLVLRGRAPVTVER